METMKIVRLGVIIFLCKFLLCESSCTPGFETELLVFKVHRDYLHRGAILGRVIFNTCDGRSRTLFQSSDEWFDVDTDGTVKLKREVDLHEGHKVFSVHAWDSSGKKHTVSVRVERVRHHEDHHMDTVMNISSPQMDSHSDDLVLMFPKSSKGLKRAKRDWVVPPFNVIENMRGPFPIKLVQIKSDMSKEAQIQYRITGEGADLDPKGLFIIERLSGNLFVTRALDRETKASYRLEAHATGVDANVGEKPMEIIVHVLDQNDNRPVFTQNSFNGNVPEAAEIGHEFMTVTATDADDPETDNAEIRYSIIKQEPESPNPNMFQINSVTGGILVNSLGLDREKWSKYTLTVVVTDMEGKGYQTTGTAVITVTDSNDNAPQFDQPSHTVSVPENKVGAEVAKLTVTDGDEEGSPAWSTKYRIISGDKGGFFSVSTGPSQLEGVITTVKPLDFEKNKQYILSVIVENEEPFVGSLATSTATVTVNVEDVNDPPEFNPKEKIIYKPEDSPVDSEVVSYTATDPDIGKPQKIMYKIGNDPDGWLSVNQNTGSIKVRKPMDRESSRVKDGKYRAIILAMDDDNPPATGTGTLIIELSDVNDNAPVINERNIKICNRGSNPVLLSITDKDVPPNAGPFTVETQGETSRNWSAMMSDTSTGVFLKLKSALKEGKYNVVLRVFDRESLFQDNTIQATVCDCEKGSCLERHSFCLR
ncbi:cadherin-1-like [Chanodichthys erythropterus]|uniref:cadherin-1-like n=1 Tax=Chanodichthys erythropterus TaxID=933992 RepID=UPI00351F350C